METDYELKLASGKVVKWTGDTGENAAKRYVDMHRDCSVIAWREVRRGLFLYNPNYLID